MPYWDALCSISASAISRDFQRFSERAGRIRTGIAHAALNHADISLMKASLLRDGLTTQFPGFPMPLQDHGKSIRNFHPATAHPQMLQRVTDAS
jgi:hypothetical protein